MANGVFALVCLCAVLGAGKAAAAVAPFLKTRNLGQLVGEQEISEDGTSYYSFKGLRYALPPVGDLRFKVLSRTDKSTTPCNHLDTRVVQLPTTALIGSGSRIAKC